MAREQNTDLERFDDESPIVVPDHVEVDEQLGVGEPLDTAESVQADETSNVTVHLAEGVEGPVHLSLPLSGLYEDVPRDDAGRIVVEDSAELPPEVADLAVETRKVVAE